MEGFFAPADTDSQPIQVFLGTLLDDLLPEIGVHVERLTCSCQQRLCQSCPAHRKRLVAGIGEAVVPFIDRHRIHFCPVSEGIIDQ